MKARLIDWWQGRTRREHHMLFALAVVGAGVLGWLLVVRPLGLSLAAAKDRHEHAVIVLSETRARVDEIRKLQSVAAPASTVPVATLVGKSATDAGFPIARLESDGGAGVTFAIAAARPQAFFAWLAEMETARGLVVDRLTARPNTDQTLAVQVSLRRRGA